MMELAKDTILVVDDVPENIDVVTAILQNDYIVKAAINAKVAQRIAQTQKPDLILLDISMPEIDGFQLCRQLKSDEKTSSIPIIFVTSNDADVNEAEGLELGGSDYIEKPVSPVRLKARIQSHLKLSKLTKGLESQVLERTKELEASRLEILARLGRAAEYRDNETGQHVIRVGLYCETLAKGLGLSDEFCSMIRLASPMHDIGKIGISDNILLKPAKLTPEEYEVIKTHCYIGEDILKDSTSDVLIMARVIAASHHEKWDGTGYPRGLVGEEIPLEGRITAIADVFDALSASRPYKKGWEFDKIIAFFQEQSGKHFDPQIVSIFLMNIEDFRGIWANNKDTWDH